MASLISTPPRDLAGQPVGYVDAAGSPSLAGKFFAYRADGGAWKYAGIFPCEADARHAAGLPCLAPSK
jgi:hypothetical protein